MIFIWNYVSALRSDNPLERAAVETKRPFDLELGSLLRVRVVEGLDGRLLVVLIIHHVGVRKFISWCRLLEIYGLLCVISQILTQYTLVQRWISLLSRFIYVLFNKNRKNVKGTERGMKRIGNKH